MSGLVEAATAILCASERRLEISAHNVANISTPGFKRQIGFLQAIENQKAEFVSSTELRVSRNFEQGKLGETGNPLDLAITGEGFFQLRSGDSLIYSRQGQFRMASDGTVVSPQGYVLQQQGGGDLILDRDAVTVAQDGTVLDEERPIARIGLFAPADPSSLQPVGESYFSAGLTAMEAVAEPVIRQGAIEHSNVDLGNEMVSIMAAMRQSEAGARLVQVYDDLIGRAISGLGQGR